MQTHSYALTVTWTGDRGEGTRTPRAYARDHEVRIEGKPALLGSSDPAFSGDPARHNPEELLVAALSSCHMLWYLDLCARAGVVVVGYEDHASGLMTEEADGGGVFTEVTLRPRVTVADVAMCETAQAQHARAAHLCFIARSVRFPVRHAPTVQASETLGRAL
jgi:organic hydroperoxide reductase OsmC/OhrA